MKKFKSKPSKVKVPLDIEEHIELASDLRKCQEILEPWMDRFSYAYSSKSKERQQIWTVLNLLSSKICHLQDNHFHNIHDIRFEKDPYFGMKSPYYGSGKVAWI